MIRRSSQIAILLLISAYNFAQSLYDPSKIQEIRLYFANSNWDQKLDSLRAADSDARLIAEKAVLNGVTYYSVGVRYKGNSTYNASRIKNPFNIKLDYIHSNQRVESYNTLKLSNGFMDPSFLREVLGYQIARQYLPAPKANFMNVYVNDVLIGLYTNVEDVDKEFLSNHFYTSDGPFFQCDRTDKQVTIPGTCPPGMPGSALKWVSMDSACYYNNYEIESAEGWQQLVNMMQVLSQNPGNVENKLDVDRALWMLAINNFYVNLDSYSGSGHNYLVFENGIGRFNTIPWDFNECFGAFTNAGTGASLNLIQMQQLDPLLHQTNSERPLISKLFSISKFRKRYLAHLYTILEEAKASNAYENEGLKLKNLIASAVSNDKNKFFSDAAFNANLYSDFTNGSGGMAKTYPGLISLSNARVNYLNTHPAINVVKPSITNVQNVPAVPEFNKEISFTAQIRNAKSASLFYRFDKEQRFVELPMYDDGLHQDGNAGDNLFAAVFNFGRNQDIQYYIYAENDDIAALSPQRAEYEFYSLHAKLPNVESGDLRINEIMPSNTSFVKDESGDYDDWIEIFNTSDQMISCYGLYLSDNPSNKLKWAFPDTSIPAKSFLVVWADEDGNDPGLHANFKLSKSGEPLMLVNQDSSAVDELTYPEVQENYSYAYCPVKWIFAVDPSFGKENNCTTLVNEQNGIGIQISPNPFHENLLLQFGRACNCEISIFNALGQRQVHQTSGYPDETEILISTADWQPGLYFLTIQSGSNLERFSLIKI